MLNQIPVLKVALHVAPEFSGRVLLYIENGMVKADAPLQPDEIIGSAALFGEILERAGYRLTPVQKG